MRRATAMILGLAGVCALALGGYTWTRLKGLERDYAARRARIESALPRAWFVMGMARYGETEEEHLQRWLFDLHHRECSALRNQHCLEVVR